MIDHAPGASLDVHVKRDIYGSMFNDCTTGADESAPAADGSQSDRTYTIADLAGEFGITARALRFYEEERLIAPHRQGTARIYSRRDRARVAWIIRARHVGFSLAEVRELLDLYHLDDGQHEQRRMAVIRCRERIALLERQRAEIDATIAELAEFVETCETAPCTSDL